MGFSILGAFENFAGFYVIEVYSTKQMKTSEKYWRRDEFLKISEYMHLIINL